MFFRVRTSLTERPGALALLATRCGEAGLNILGLQIFPDLGRVTDELVISAPDTWTAGAVAELVSGAGGDEVSVEPCTTHDLIDQPTRWLTAAHDVVADPALLPTLLDKLLGPHPEKWSASEHSRATALTSLAESVSRSGLGGRSGKSGPAPVEYDETPTGLVARIGGHVVGVAAFAPTEGRELTIEVAPAWRRLGIGTQLLTRAASQAAAGGADEIVLLASAQDEGFVNMVCGAGLRARIKATNGMLQARIVVTGVRRSAMGTPVPREDRAVTGR
jgi:ribosomal protein S18 acetylase RimI-like enzyme